LPRLAPLLLLPCLSLCLAACGASTSGAPVLPSPTHAAPAPRIAAPAPGAYAALGASETYGMGASPTSRGYAYRLARALHARRFVDPAIPGSPLHDAYDAELTAALAIRPSLATVFFGFNDLRTGVTLSAFLSDLRDLVTTLRRARARVLVIGLPNLALLPAVRRVFPGAGGIVRTWNNGMRRVALAAGARYLDLSAYSAELATHPGYIAADGLHPSNRGHARLAQVVENAIWHDHLWPRP